MAQRLRKVVDALGGQTKAALVAGVSARQIRKYLSTESGPPAVVIARLAAASGFGVEWLLAGRTEEKVSPGSRAARMAEQAARDPEKARLLEAVCTNPIRALCDTLRVGISEACGATVSPSERDALLDGLLDVIAPNHAVPANWSELTRVALATLRLSRGRDRG